MISEKRNTILSTLLVSGYFFVALLLLNGPAQDSLIVATTGFLSSFMLFGLLLQYIIIPLSIRIKHNYPTITRIIPAQVFLPALLFSYLYFWWFLIGINSWRAAYYSITHAVILTGAFFVSLLSGTLLFAHIEKCSGAKKIKSRQKILIIQSIRKITLPVLAIAFVVFRITSGFTNNTGISTSSIRTDEVIEADENKTALILALENVSLNTLMNQAIQSGLPNITRIIGESTVGIIPDHNCAEAEQFWRDILIISESANNTRKRTLPLDSRHADLYGKIGVSDFLTSLIFFDTGVILRSLKEQQRHTEPVWDTAERYGIKTGSINFPFSQTAVTGFYIADTYFSKDELIPKNEIFPETLTEKVQEPTTIDDSRHDSLLTLFQHTPGIRELYEHSLDINTAGIKALEEIDIDMLFVRFSAKTTAPAKTARHDSLVYLLIDDFIGFWTNPANKQFQHTIIIGYSPETEKDSFVLYRTPFRQLSEKSVLIDHKNAGADLLYIMSLPFLQHSPLSYNKSVFHQDYLTTHPPQFVDQYPPIAQYGFQR
ncbi:hypothetical protein ACFL6L_02335 [candidate division KSB1 bacterium]